MESIRKGLRSGAVEKDTYGRLRCTDCEEELTTANDPKAIGKVRSCPACDRAWKELG